MTRSRIAVFAVFAACLAVASPAAAHGDGQGGPQSGNGQHGQHGQNGQHGFAGYGVSSPVVDRLNRVERSLSRAEDYIDDEDNTKAAAALRGVQHNMTKALKLTNAQVTSNSDRSKFTAMLFTSVADHVVQTTGADFDGVTDPGVSTELANALDNAVTGRDSLLATIIALPDHSSYGWVFGATLQNANDEKAALNDSLAQDDLTADEKTAISNALTKLDATIATVTPLATTQQDNGWHGCGGSMKDHSNN